MTSSTASEPRRLVRDRACHSAEPIEVTSSKHCPICGGEASRLHDIKNIFYLRCPECTHQFPDYVPAPNHVSDHYDDQYFSGGGDGYPDYLGSRGLVVAHGRALAKKVAKLTGKRTGDLLDIGSAAGFLARGFQDSGWTAHGLEPSKSMCDHANSVEGIHTISATLEELETDRRFDLVVMAQVIGHLEDPAAAMRTVKSLLKPGGHVLIETWDNSSLTAKFLKGRWHEYNPPSVLHAFSKHSLAILANRSGFKTIHTQRITKKISAAHGKAILEHKYGASPRHRFFLKPILTLIPNRLTLPYPADDLFWSLLTLA